MSIIIAQFFIGFFLANALPHLIAGLMDIKLLSLFGFSAKGNIAYSIWNVCLAAGIGIYMFGFEALLQHTFFWGMLTVFLIYALVGRSLYLRWNTSPDIV